MNDLLVQLDDLPDEILMYIFKKLYNDEVLYSLMDVNQRLNRILHDRIFTRHLRLLKYCRIDNSTIPLPDSILHRFCSKILPKIGHQIETLYLERTSIERVLHATNYINLKKLGLCDIQYKDAMSLFTDDFDESIVALLRRMLNLEELDLNIQVQCYEKFIDGDTLKKDIIIYMPQLYKLTFNICSIINHRDQTIFPLNEDIQKTFKYFSNQIITCIDHFQEEGCSQCHIYSYPYKWKVYNYITNNFPGGLFTSVTQVSLYDERPFEHEFFLRIQKSFPYLKELTINNRKAQNNKQLIKLNNDYQILSIIEYPYLTRLNIIKTHDDYVEFFLFDTKISLPNNLHLCVDYQSLKRVTYDFTRYITRNHSSKLAALYLSTLDQIDEHIKNYFPHAYFRCFADFVLSN
ncbi:unnamed protein product [Rotaria sp. Silwood1]|nr:unnamed protein product [Rotaria sp. Silwood1]